MTLSETARERLADVVALQPTKNAELQERWGMESGSEVHHYLESELGEYYYRDEDSLIRATADAAALVGAEEDQVVRVPPLQAAVLEVVAGPEERSESVVSVLGKLRESGRDPPVEDVRAALRNLADRGLLERNRRTVPTYRLALPREELEVEPLERRE